MKFHKGDKVWDLKANCPAIIVDIKNRNYTVQLFNRNMSQHEGVYGDRYDSILEPLIGPIYMPESEYKGL